MICNLKVFLFLLCGLKCVMTEPLNDEARKICLSMHNDYRKALANGEVKNGVGETMPKATDMNKLRYLKKFEIKAQTEVEKCAFDANQVVGSYNAILLPKVLDQKDAIKEAINVWWNEVENFDSTDVHYHMDNHKKNIFHFSQMAMGRAGAFGCSMKICSGKSYVVCKYNVPIRLDQPVYKVGGEPCSSCDPKRKYCKEGLCAKCAPK